MLTENNWCVIIQTVNKSQMCEKDLHKNNNYFIQAATVFSVYVGINSCF